MTRIAKTLLLPAAINRNRNDTGKYQGKYFSDDVEGPKELNREKGCPGRNKEEAQKPSSICSSRRSAEGKLEEDLRAETVKWQEKAQDLYGKVSGDGEFLENVSAYIRDCQYFLDKGDLIRAFEAVIWAWAWMEIGLQKGLLQQKE